MRDMLTFQSYDNVAAAEETAQTLRAHGIQVTVEQPPSLLDSNFIGQDFGNHVLVKLWPDDFERAQKILIDSTVIDMNEVDRNYMLFQMTDKELRDVLAAPDEWGAWNYKLAALILAERGVSVTEKQTAVMQETHRSKLSVQRSINSNWLVLGYGFSALTLISAFLPFPGIVVALFSFQLLPGILGIILGLILINSRKTLPDGSQVKTYDAKAREHGRMMIICCILSIICCILILRARYN